MTCLEQREGTARRRHYGRQACGGATLSLELVPTLLDGETPDPTLEPASVSATF